MLKIILKSKIIYTLISLIAYNIKTVRGKHKYYIYYNTYSTSIKAVIYTIVIIYIHFERLKNLRKTIHLVLYAYIIKHGREIENP